MWCNMVSQNLANISSDHVLFPHNAKPLAESTLSYTTRFSGILSVEGNFIGNAEDVNNLDAHKKLL